MDKLSFASLFSNKRETFKEEEKLNIKGEKKVYVAVSDQIWPTNGRNILSWVLNNFSKDTKIIVTYVQRRTLLCDELELDSAKAERESIEKDLSDYLSQCSENEFEAEKLMHEVETNLEIGLVEVTNLHGVSNLVMGAAWYSKGMTEVKSNMAKIVIQRAHPSCQIWFICEGTGLVFTRYNVFGRNYSTIDNFHPGGPIPPMYLHCSIEGTSRSDAASASYVTSQDIYNNIRANISNRRQIDKRGRCAWDTIWLAAAWTIWKSRNKKIFQGAYIPPIIAMDQIVNDVSNWMLHA